MAVWQTKTSKIRALPLALSILIGFVLALFNFFGNTRFYAKKECNNFGHNKLLPAKLKIWWWTRAGMCYQQTMRSAKHASNIIASLPQIKLAPKRFCRKSPTTSCHPKPDFWVKEIWLPRMFYYTVIQYWRWRASKKFKYLNRSLFSTIGKEFVWKVFCVWCLKDTPPLELIGKRHFLTMWKA